MADGWQTYPVEFRGGLVTSLSPIQQGINAPGTARQLRNFEPAVNGGYRRISGYSKYADTVVPGTGFIRSVFYYDGKVFAVRNNTGAGEGELYESSGSADTWTRVSTDSIRFSSGNGKVRIAKFNFDGTERVVLVDGVNTPFILTGTTLTKPTLTSAQAGASHVEVFKDHIFLGKATSIISSAPLGYADAAGWSVANNANDLQINDTITGLKVFRDQLYIFSSSQINRLQGSSWNDFARIPVSADLGCAEEDTIQELAGDVVFMGPDGIRLLSGTERIGDVGLGAITKSIQSNITEFENRNNTFSSLVVREKSQYRVFGYNSSTPRAESQGFIGTQFSDQGAGDVAWAELRGIQAYVAYSEYTGSTEVYLFANDTGYVYSLESGISFDGEDIQASFFTPFLSINDPTIRKTMYVAHTYLDPDGSFNADMGINYDFNQGIRQDLIPLSNDIGSDSEIGLYGTAVYGTSVYGSAVRVTLRKQVTGSGFVTSIEYTSSGSTQPFTLDAMALEYATESRR